jgi:hypothetical protein|tara:strand:- start:656 stop:805 length:150 start_codon:yes stop_codon:yes gene_type:complete
MAKKDKKVEEEVPVKEEPAPSEKKQLDYKVINTGRGRVKQYFDGRVEPY